MRPCEARPNDRRDWYCWQGGNADGSALRWPGTGIHAKRGMVTSAKADLSEASSPFVTTVEANVRYSAQSNAILMGFRRQRGSIDEPFEAAAQATPAEADASSPSSAQRLRGTELLPRALPWPRSTQSRALSLAVLPHPLRRSDRFEGGPQAAHRRARRFGADIL